MLTAVSMSCTAIGLLFEFEAENVYIVASHLHPTEQKLQQPAWNEVLYHYESFFI
jgi:hypothetical protein